MPDPDLKKLAATQAAVGKASGRSTVRFCVTPEGKTEDVTIVERFPGDPEIDRICRETVEKWRLRPFMTDGPCPDSRRIGCRAALLVRPCARLVSRRSVL